MAIWTLVADAGRARFFSAESATDTLVEVEDRLHPESRLHAGEMASDEPGTTHDSHGQGQHGMGNKVDPKSQEAIRFAKELCEELESQRNAGKLDALYVIAEPAFLGVLREHMDAPLKKLVQGEIDKDLTEHAVADIRGHLPARL